MFEKFRGRSRPAVSRNPNTSIVQLLEPVQQHRAIFFIQDISPNLHHKVRTNPNEHPVKRSVMQFAQGKTVSDFRNPLRFAVRHNMRRVEELTVSQATQCTLFTISV